MEMVVINEHVQTVILLKLFLLVH